MSGSQTGQEEKGKIMDVKEMYVVLITAADEDEAGKLSRTLLDERLIACANRFPVRSIYRWQGKTEDHEEVMLICKTSDEVLDNLIKRVKELHSYEVPEIVAIPFVKGNDDYLKWVKENTGSQ